MPILQASIPRALERALNANFGLSYKEFPKEGNRIYKAEPIDRAFDEDYLTVGMGAAPVKAEGKPSQHDELRGGWSQRYVPTRFGLRCFISYEMQKNYQYGKIASKVGTALGRSMAETMELSAIGPINLGRTSYLTGDAVTFFNDSHPIARGAAQSNVLATPADLSAESFEALRIQISYAKSDNGLPVPLPLKEIWCSPSNEFEAERVFKSSLLPGTGTDAAYTTQPNDINAIKSLGYGKKPPVILTRLADPTAWGICTDCPDGMKFRQREPIKRKMRALSEDDYEYMIYGWFTHGVTDWRSNYSGK